MSRSPCCNKVGLRRGTWTSEEDQKLSSYIEQYGHGSWRSLPAKAGLQRCGKSCRLRWNNYLRPDIKRGKFSLKEEQTIIQLHALLGNRWSAIASHLPKRTDNDIKNYWNTHLKKKLTKMGIDPVTHKPEMNVTLTPTQQKDTANLSHMAQWERARVQAEARLTRESKLINLKHKPMKSPPTQISLPPRLDVLQAWQAQVAAWSTTTTTSTLISIGALVSPTSTLSFTNAGGPGANHFPACHVETVTDYNSLPEFHRQPRNGDNYGDEKMELVGDKACCTVEQIDDDEFEYANAIYGVDIDQSFSSFLTRNNDDEHEHQNSPGNGNLDVDHILRNEFSWNVNGLL